jgi:hypothetical protein
MQDKAIDWSDIETLPFLRALEGLNHQLMQASLD